MKTRVSIIMAVFNEIKTVSTAIDGALSNQVDSCVFELIIVESNSSDGSRERVLEYLAHPNVRVILQDSPKGKGNAIREGLRAATGDIVLIQDADLEYDFLDYKDVLAPILSNKSDFVLGSRHGGSKWKVREFKEEPFLSFITNFVHWGLAYFINSLYFVRLTDPFTMFKVFKRSIIKNLVLTTNRFDFDYELLLKLIRIGHKPFEVPVSYRARSFDEGKKIKFFPDPFVWVWVIIKYRFLPKAYFIKNE